jgi:hypothetical protein
VKPISDSAAGLVTTAVIQAFLLADLVRFAKDIDQAELFWLTFLTWTALAAAFGYLAGTRSRRR